MRSRPPAKSSRSPLPSASFSRMDTRRLRFRRLEDSLVTIRLEAASRGTRLHLVHEFADAAARDHHVQGWRYQLSLFANVVSDEALHDAPGRVDRWFDAWAESDDAARRQALTDIVVSQYPPSRSLQLRGRDRRAHRTHRCRTAVHARRQDEGRWRSAPVPGHGPRRVDREGRSTGNRDPEARTCSCSAPMDGSNP